MSVTATTHLNFRGNARAALDFYRAVFGGDQVVVSYADSGYVPEPSEADQVMWGQVSADNGFRIMAYDVPSRTAWNPGENALFASVGGDEAEEIKGFWARLSEGGVVVQPLAPAAWSALYGMLKDRFGVTWVLNVTTAPGDVR